MISSLGVDVVAERRVHSVHGGAEGAVQGGLVVAPLAEGGHALTRVRPKKKELPRQFMYDIVPSYSIAVYRVSHPIMQRFF